MFKSKRRYRVSDNGSDFVATPLIFETEAEAERYAEHHNSRSLFIEGFGYVVRVNDGKYHVGKVKIGHFG